ncbi:MAG: cyclic nucleotide-binding domain-containing protein [Gammaproteobacteria bacterium]|nr:cyclic nucleotide-binding domain-containing protein [Gammaproteobacteria bacterium]
MSKELIAILAKSELFSGFSSEQLEQVVSHLQPRTITLDSGDRVYKKGHLADRCWLIQSGNLTVQRASLRAPFCNMLYHKGSVTGIQGIADAGSERVVTMIAEDKVELIEITHGGIARLDQEAQIQLWKNVSRLLLRKLAVCFARESLDD